MTRPFASMKLDDEALREPSPDARSVRPRISEDIPDALLEAPFWIAGGTLIGLSAEGRLGSRLAAAFCIARGLKQGIGGVMDIVDPYPDNFPQETQTTFQTVGRIAAGVSRMYRQGMDMIYDHLSDPTPAISFEEYERQRANQQPTGSVLGQIVRGVLNSEQRAAYDHGATLPHEAPAHAQLLPSEETHENFLDYM